MQRREVAGEGHDVAAAFRQRRDVHDDPCHAADVFWTSDLLRTVNGSEFDGSNAGTLVDLIPDLGLASSLPRGITSVGNSLIWVDEAADGVKPGSFQSFLAPGPVSPKAPPPPPPEVFFFGCWFFCPQGRGKGKK